MGILRTARARAHMNLERLAGRMLSIAQSDLWRMSTRNWSLSMAPGPTTSMSISGMKSRYFSLWRTKRSSSSRRVWMWAKVALKKLAWMQSCSRMAFAR